MTAPANPLFPAIRMRRMRKDAFSRALMRENHVTVEDLIYPVFIVEGEQQRQAVGSCPAWNACRWMCCWKPQQIASRWGFL
jgi:delta-aminolevulinic acid dehydratase/porphobilinogen synthase